MATKNDLSKIQSYQYPAAHLGHLTPPQHDALQEFKRLCEKQGLYKPAQGGAIPSHDDETMLRYLRARRFDPTNAYQQFRDTENWRSENRLAELYETMDVKEYEETRRLYPQWTGRRDRRGIPVYVFEVAPLNAKAVSAYEHSTSSKSPAVTASGGKVPVKMLRLFALYESLVRFVMPLCSAVPNRPHPETPISQSNNIVDISKVGLKQFWNLKNHMQDASQLATAYYPETLDRIFIIGAPAFFPTVWGWIKRWFDPITVSKIFILTSANARAVLEQYIDSANIPRKYGGALDFAFGDMPVLDPDLAAAMRWGDGARTQRGAPTLPPGPVRFEEGDRGEMVAVAVGTESGTPRRTVVATLPTPYRAALHLTTTNTELDPAMEPLTGVGTDTHPREGEVWVGNGDDAVDESESSGAATPSARETEFQKSTAGERNPVPPAPVGEQAGEAAGAAADGAVAAAETVMAKVKSATAGQEQNGKAAAGK